MAAAVGWSSLLLQLLVVTRATARLLHLNDTPTAANDSLEPALDYSHIPALAAYTATIGSGFRTNQLYVYFERGLLTDIVDRMVRHPRQRIPPVTLRK